MDATKTGFAAAYVTVPDLETGKRIGRALVADKLAACVNIIPGLTSIYQWEGEVNEDAELLLMIKTRSDIMSELTAKVESLHPYDVCEVISVPITDGSKAYLQFLEQNTKGPTDS